MEVLVRDCVCQQMEKLLAIFYITNPKRKPQFIYINDK